MGLLLIKIGLLHGLAKMRNIFYSLLTLTSQNTYSADNKLVIFINLFIFHPKLALTLQANCLQRRQFACGVKAYFLKKKKIIKNNKYISRCHPLKILPKALKLNGSSQNERKNGSPLRSAESEGPD